MWIWRIRSRNMASTLATASALSSGFCKPSILSISHSCHKFHISWLCIIGAIKNVRTWVIGAQTFEAWAAPTPTNFRMLSRVSSSPHISLTSSERSSREFRSMSVSICSLRIGIADVIRVNSGNTRRTTTITHRGSRSLLVQKAPVTFRRCLYCSRRVLQLCVGVMVSIRL